MHQGNEQGKPDRLAGREIEFRGPHGLDLQSKLESHQPEHTMNYLAAAGKKLVNTPLLLPCGARAPRRLREGTKGEH